MDRDTFDIDIKGSGFNIATMLITGFMFGIAISNTVYFSRIADKPSEAISSGAAKAMLGINIVLAVLSGFIFLWSSYKLVVANEDKFDTMNKYVSNTRKRMRKIRQNAEMSMRELDNIDTTDDEMFNTSSYKVFDSPMTSSASDTDFTDFD
jgi:hypothetical protein